MEVNTIKLLDKYIGGMICALFPRILSSKKTKYNKILAIQLWSIGETILTLPAIQSLKNKYGCIDVLCTSNNKAVFESVNFIDNLFVLEDFTKDIPSFIIKNIFRYDLVYDFEEYLNISGIISRFVGKYSIGFTLQDGYNRDLLYNEKVFYDQNQHVVETFCNLVGTQAPSMCLGTQLKGEKSDFLKNNKITEFIGICVTSSGTSANNRQWPYFKELITKLKEDVIIFKSPDENVDDFLVRDRVFVWEGTLKQSFEVIKKAKLFISNDTGPMHIAAAQGVKTIGLFGPNHPKRFAPYGSNNISLYHSLNCSPCINVHRGKTPECDDVKCMKLISVEEVLAQF